MRCRQLTGLASDADLVWCVSAELPCHREAQSAGISTFPLRRESLAQLSETILPISGNRSALARR